MLTLLQGRQAEPIESGKIGGVNTPETSEPINIKFGKGDCVSNITPHAKNQSYRPVGRPGTWVKYHSGVVFNVLFLLFCDPNRIADFYAIWFIRRQFHVVAFLER